MLTCNICGKRFVFTVSEQKRSQAEGDFRTPMQCKDCRGGRRNNKTPEKQGNREIKSKREFKCGKCGSKITANQIRCSNCRSVNGFCPWCRRHTAFDKYHFIKRNSGMSFWERTKADLIEGFLEGLDVGFSHNDEKKRKQGQIDNASEYKYVCINCNENVFINTWSKAIRKWKDFD